MPLLDQDLPARAQQGDENALAALIARMMPAIRKGAAECTAPGLDFDDAVQEGLIGLFHAVRGFDPAAGQTFTAYAAACIRHAQQDARRAALRKKHAPLNYSVPLPDAEESTDTRPGPEEIAISGEQYADTMRRMQTELSVSFVQDIDFQSIFYGNRIENGFQIMVSVRTFFRNGQPQVYFDIRESNHGVIYFLCYDYVFGGKVTKIFIFPYSFFIIIFYLCRPD